MKKHFNLIDDPWIPIADIGLVSLLDIFTQPRYKMIGGNPIQKLAIFKLLQAIAQAAKTPKDQSEWQELGQHGLAELVCKYLEKNSDKFNLYGNQPFLQMPSISKAEIKSFGTLIPEIATGNTTVLTQSQTERALTDAEKALLIVVQMAFALGGKKTDNRVVLTPGYTGKSKENGKPTSGKPGPSIAHMGLLHTYGLGSSLMETIWLNLFTHDEISELSFYSNGLGTAPWEKMPEGENCSTAIDLKNSLMGRLIPLCRFCLLTDEGIHYSEGIAHLNYKEGIYDPSIAVDLSGKEVKTRWCDPDKRPWRYLTSFLSFIDTNNSSRFDCIQLRLFLKKAKHKDQAISIWSGGLRVSSNAGEQYVSGMDDFIESLSSLIPSQTGEIWFKYFEHEMIQLDKLAKILYGCVFNYYREFKVEGSNYASHASNLFWQLAEQQSQELINGCDNPTIRFSLRKKFADYIFQIFNQTCPYQSARQLESWAKTKPNLSNYLQEDTSDEQKIN
ncbi:type I-E CRISPR-associated protein Cse1/CasA [Thorsellia anophelis]|uniref:CRISPR system Cascade subunit CasA n=1 Tax=Thorsellia anophelis DSM 18579 TaxID=1123402 RepID=A0A1I0C284_9GAMM|nr:type I-E CRISPR-associated protein Cse1/CasA [Thorsellia anophelis]SET13493.1 CRISPR system Cascade subunit CasA [Thorsellia anophelis DSM 18579]